MKLELNINELILDGIAPDHEYQIRAAIERELARLFAAEGTPDTLAGGSDLPALDLQMVRVPANLEAGAIGVHVAQSLYRNLTGTRAAPTEGLDG